MRLNHAAAEKMRFFLMFHNAEYWLDIVQPLFQRTEFQILDAARRRNQFDLRNIRCTRIAVQLSDIRDAVIFKPFADIRIVCSSLKKAISKEEHPLPRELAEHLRVQQRLSVPYRI